MKTESGDQGRAGLAAALRDDIARALSTAALSPSSHNSQPWEIMVVGSEQRRGEMRRWLEERTAGPANDEPEEACLVLALDGLRCLHALPAFELEMNLSCGAYLESLWLGLKAQGREARIVWVNEEGIDKLPMLEPWPDTWRPVAIMRVGRKQASAADADCADAACLRRRITNRGPYASTALSEDIRRSLAVSGSRAFTGPACEVVLLQEREICDRLGAFVSAWAGVEFEDPAVWEETYRHLRFGQEAGDCSATGLPISQLFGPLPGWARHVLRGVLAPACIRLLKHVGLPGYFARQMGALVSAAPLIVLLAFDEENPGLPLQLAGGGQMLGVWLAATRAGLALHPISVVLQHPHLRHRLQREFGLPGRVFFLARVGVPRLEFPAAPKRIPVWDNILVI